MDSVCKENVRAAIAVACVIASLCGYGGLSEFCLDQNRKPSTGSVYSYGGGMPLMIKQVLPGEGVLAGLERNLEMNCYNPGYIFIKTDTQGMSDNTAMFGGYFRCVGTYSYVNAMGAQRTIPAFERLSAAEVSEMLAKQAAEAKRAAEERERRELAEQPARKEHAQKAISALDLVLEKKVFVERNQHAGIMLSVKHFLWKELLEAKRTEDWLSFLNVAEDIINNRTSKTTTYTERYPSTEQIDNTLLRLAEYKFRVVISMPPDCAATKLRSGWLELQDFCANKSPSIAFAAYMPFDCSVGWHGNEPDNNTLSMSGVPIYILSKQFIDARVPSSSYCTSLQDAMDSRRHSRGLNEEAPSPKWLIVEWAEKQAQVKAHEISSEERMDYIRSEFSKVQNVLNDTFVPLSETGGLNYSQSDESQSALEEYAKELFSKIKFDIEDNILVEREFAQALSFKVKSKEYQELADLQKQEKWLDMMTAAKEVCKARKQHRLSAADAMYSSTWDSVGMKTWLIDENEKTSQYPAKPVIANFAEAMKSMGYVVVISEKEKRVQFQLLGVAGYVVGWDKFQASFEKCPKQVVSGPLSAAKIDRDNSARVVVYPNRNDAILLIGQYGDPDSFRELNVEFRPLPQLIKKLEEHEITEAEAHAQYEIGCAKIRQKIKEKFIFLSGKNLDGDVESVNAGVRVGIGDAKLVASEENTAVAEFMTLSRTKVFSSLRWDIAETKLTSLKESMKTAAGVAKVDDMLYRVHAMKQVQDIFIQEAPGGKFKTAKLKGYGIVEADSNQLKLQNGRAFIYVPWAEFYNGRRGNLNELINRFVVDGQKNKRHALQPDEWADAMCGAALTLKYICGDSSSAIERSEQLISQVAAKYPEKVEKLSNRISAIPKNTSGKSPDKSNSKPMPAPNICSRCGGRKYIQTEGRCPTCNGSGRVVIPPKKMVTGYSAARSSTCTSCSGKGTSTQTVPCPNCR